MNKKNQINMKLLLLCTTLLLIIATAFAVPAPESQSYPIYFVELVG